MEQEDTCMIQRLRLTNHTTKVPSVCRWEPTKEPVRSTSSLLKLLLFCHFFHFLSKTCSKASNDKKWLKVLYFLHSILRHIYSDSHSLYSGKLHLFIRSGSFHPPLITMELLPLYISQLISTGNVRFLPLIQFWWAEFSFTEYSNGHYIEEYFSQFSTEVCLEQFPNHFSLLYPLSLFVMSYECSLICVDVLVALVMVTRRSSEGCMLFCWINLFLASH